MPKTDGIDLHAAYLEMLSLLDLTTEHRRKLNDRGLSDAEIDAAGYKTLPASRKELISGMLRKRKTLFGIPGFYRQENGDWALAGKPGILIPVRARGGKIEAMKVRLDNPGTQSQKYLLLSSNPKTDRKASTQKYPSGTSAKACVHFPLGAPKKIKTIRVTEGELKADIATSLADVYTICIPGVAMWKMAIQVIKDLKAEKVLLGFDSDKSEGRNVEGVTDKAYGNDYADGKEESVNEGKEDFVVGKHVAAFYTALKKEGVPVVIEDWPLEAGKGIDDVLVSGATDLITEWDSVQSDEFVELMIKSDLPKDWVYIIGIKRFVHSGELTELDKEQYDDRYCHEQNGKPSSNALNNVMFPKCDLPVYLPNKDVLLADQRGRRLFNLWRPGVIQPEEGDVKFFLNHCEYIIPDKAERAILLDWLAYNLQHPGDKIHWAMVLQGSGQGTGKSFFGWMMRQLLGSHNVSLPTNENLHEPYTHWQKACSLVVIEEIMAKGRLELMNKLKPIITQEVTTVREMFKPAYEQANVFNLLMFTNYEDALILDNQDRRYCVIFSPAIPQAPTYYRELFETSATSLGALLHFFLHRDLSQFEPKGHAPMTSGKKTLIELSVPPIQFWMRECIANEAWPFQSDLVSASHLMECLPRGLNASQQAIGRALGACGARQVGQVKLSNNSSARLWAVRRIEVWESAEKPALAADFEKWASGAQPGGRPDSYNPLKEQRPV